MHDAGSPKRTLKNYMRIWMCIGGLVRRTPKINDNLSTLLYQIAILGPLHFETHPYTQTETMHLLRAAAHDSALPTCARPIGRDCGGPPATPTIREFTKLQLGKKIQGLNHGFLK